MTDDVIKWIENETVRGKQFMKWYRVSNLIINLGTVHYRTSSFEDIVSTMALYFDSEGDYYKEFGKTFKEKFPEKYKKIIEQLNDPK